MRGELLVPVVGGAHLRVDMTDVVGRVLATSGIWEPNVTAVFRHLLSPGDVCVDVGAHIGYYTLLASKLVQPGGHVYALEPSPTVYARLDANLARNRASNVTALCLAAGAHDGSAFLRDPGPTNSGGWTIVQDAERISAGDDGADVVNVATRPLSSILDPEHRERLRLVKIDVEGFEHEVLRGLGDMLGGSARPAVLVELHPQAAVEAATLLDRLLSTYELRAYELPKPGTYDRFSVTATVRPTELGSISEPQYQNVLLAPAERVAGWSSEVA